MTRQYFDAVFGQLKKIHVLTTSPMVIGYARIVSALRELVWDNAQSCLPRLNVHCPKILSYSRSCVLHTKC
jgi:hypothetical protein